MPAFQHILFPVDFSDGGRAAQPLVISMARHFGAKLTLLNVVDIPAGWQGDLGTPYPVMLDIPAMLEAAEKRLSTYIECSDPPQIARVVQRGDPATQITTLAKENNVDLIMMPTRGYGKFRSLLLGSVTAKVLHDAGCAVWTAAHTDDPEFTEHAKCQSILCAVELALESVDLVRYAVDLANSFKAKLRLVHATSAPEAHSGNPRDAEFRKNLLAWTRERITAIQRQAGTTLEVCLEGGAVSAVVRDAALQQKADLIVIGRGKHREALGSLRTNAYAIIRDSPCPVLRA